MPVNGQGSSSIRISCPQCGGKVKLPFQDGQKYHCPRCSAELVAPGGPPSEAVEGQASASTPVSDADTLRPHRPGSSPEDDEFGISCQVCQTRLHVHPMQIGTTVQCPDCYSPVIVNAPPKRKQPWQAAERTWDDADTTDGPTATEIATQKRLEKARAEREQEEAEKRESSPERFTDGLLAFFADPQAIARLAILAIWYELAMTLFRCAMNAKTSENAPAILGEAASLAVTLAMGFTLLTFLFAAAACGLALVKDTSDGLRKIKNWPGIDFRAWGWDVFYIVNAGFLAALPGVALGIVLSLVGVSGSVLFTAAASFGAMFPPSLLSMLESNSAKAPFSKAAWSNIGKRPDPWKLAYLITTLVIIAGLFALVFCLVSGFLIGLVLATALVALMMIYFRTVGRLFGILAGRDVEPAARS